MTRSVIHPKLLARLQEHFFTDRCAIEEATDSQNDFGEVEKEWAVVQGHEAIPCTIAPVDSPEERNDAQMTVTDATHTIMLAGHFPDVATAQRAVVGETAYDIRSVDVDSKATMTRLMVRLVTV